MEETDILRNPEITKTEIDINGYNGKDQAENLDNMTLDQATDMIEKKMILKAIDKAHGNKNKAAELLDINRKTLYRKMKKLGIS